MAYRYPQIDYSVQKHPSEVNREEEGLTKAVWKSFLSSGQDDWTKPPGQDPDSFELLENVMPIVDGSINKRWGYSLWSSTNANAPFQLLDYQNDNANPPQRNVVSIEKLTGFVKAFSDTGALYNPSILSSPYAVGGRAVCSRSYLYITNGTVYKKWDGGSATTATNWGIDVNNATSGASSGSVGPSAPATVVDLGASGTSGSQGPLGATLAVDEANSSHVDFYTDGVLTSSTDNTSSAWTDASDGATQDGAFASAFTLYQIAENPNVDGELDAYAHGTDWLTITNLNFSIPSTATITGITVSLLKYSTFNVGTLTGYVIDNNVILTKAGTRTGNDYASGTAWPTSPDYSNYGSAGDLWGTGWTPSDINNPGFGVSLRALPAGWPPPTTPGYIQQSAFVDGVEITVSYTLPSAASWTGPTNIEALDGVYATSTASTTPTSTLRVSNYGFALGSSTVVTGIQVDVYGLISAAPTGPTYSITLDKAGALYTGPKTSAIPTSLAYTSFGGPGDLWGGAWLYSDINAAGFGFELTGATGGGSGLLQIDFVRVTVFYSQPSFLLSAPGGGGLITLNNGRRYTITFANTLTTHYSDIWAFTVSTGALTTNTQPLTFIPVSNDPQVNAKYLLATADGGDETRLYMVAELSASATTYTDNMPEATLLNQPVFLSTDANGVEHGVTDNDPPSTLATVANIGPFYPTKHRGQLYAVNGPLLYWSKSLDDVTTDSGFIAGRWEECWPPDNTIDISEVAETARGLLSDGINLYIGTEFKIRRLNGSAPFLEPPDIVHNEVGIANQDVWKIVYKEGTPAGAIWLTPDNRIIISDFNTYQDVGASIQATLNTINIPAVANAAYAFFYSNGPYDIYGLCVPTGTNTLSDTVCIFNLRTGRWVIWKLADTVGAPVFHIQNNGTPQLLFGNSVNANIYQLVPNSTQDRIGMTPVPITSTLRTSWQDFGDPSLRKYLNEIEFGTIDSALTVTVEGASSSDTFSNPNTVIDSRTVKKSPFGNYKIYCAASPSKDRLYRFTLTSSGAVSDMLDEIIVEYYPVNRL